MEQPVADFPGLDVASLLAEHALHGRTALVTQTETISYSAFAERVYAAAIDLADLPPGFPVGVSVSLEVEHLVVTMALLALGIPSVVFPSHESAGNIAAIAAALGVSHYAGEKRADLPRNLIPVPVRFEGRKGTRPSWRVLDAGDDAIFRTTSGTTGRPKIFSLSGLRLWLMARNAADNAEQRRILRTSSVEYDSSRLSRVSALLAGNACVLVSDLSAGSILASCARHEVTQLHVGTYRLTQLLNGARSHLPSCASLLTGGSRVPGALRQAVQERLCRRLFVSYATSEVGLVSMAWPEEHAEFPDGIGFASPRVIVEIVDESGAPVAPGSVGEVRVRKLAAPEFYVGEPEASAMLLNNWFRTRDLVSQRPGEPMIFHGRADDLMTLNGINIFGSAIEDTLLAMPQVAEAVAYPLHSRVHGQIPVAAVVLNPDLPPVSPQTMMQFCRARLGVGSPRQVFVVDDIPRSATGKPVRDGLPGS